MTAGVAWLTRWPETAEAGPEGSRAQAWIGQPADVPPPAAPLEPTALDTAEALRRPAALRAAFLNRRLLLRRFVAALTGCPAAAVMVASDAGRPCLQPPLQGVFVSTASREGWVALALAASPVGVDVERVGPAREPAWNVLSPAEQAALRRRPKEERWPAFLTLWTAKEAYLKAIGLGLSREPRTIEVTVRGASLAIRDRDRPAGTAAAACAELMGPGGRVSAACVTLRRRR